MLWISGGGDDDGGHRQHRIGPPDDGPGPYAKVAIFAFGFACVILVIYVVAMLWR